MNVATVAEDIGYILSTSAVRDRAERMLALASDGGTKFAVDLSKLEGAAEVVVSTIREQYPDLDVPYHSRWRHFVGDEGMLMAALAARLGSLPPEEAARSRLDLIVVSVLLDAGAGPSWRYTSSSGHGVARSEGLALASLQMFLDGQFSSQRLTQVDAERLLSLEPSVIEDGFQVSVDNVLIGVAGRTALLRQLGAVIAANPSVFPNGRPGDLIAHWQFNHGQSINAVTVFDTIVSLFGTIWPSRMTLAGRNLGDTWSYEPFGKGVEGLVPLHKLSQWMSYSVIETLEMAGFSVPGIEWLTGLAEYRNGGLFLDSGVLSLRDEEDARKRHAPGDPIIVEWRALTVALLDRIAEPVRSKLGLTAAQFPLPRVLEGGTWLAGRKLAAGLRPDGGPPLAIASDGTVF